MKKATKEEFKKEVKKLATEYDSNFLNKKDGSSAKQQSTNNTTQSQPVRSIGSLTEAEWLAMGGGEE